MKNLNTMKKALSFAVTPTDPSCEFESLRDSVADRAEEPTGTPCSGNENPLHTDNTVLPIDGVTPEVVVNLEPEVETETQTQPQTSLGREGNSQSVSSPNNFAGLEPGEELGQNGYEIVNNSSVPSTLSPETIAETTAQETGDAGQAETVPTSLAGEGNMKSTSASHIFAAVESSVSEGRGIDNLKFVSASHQFNAEFDALREILAGNRPLSTDPSGEVIMPGNNRSNYTSVQSSVGGTGNVNSISAADKFANNGEDLLGEAPRPEVPAPEFTLNEFNYIDVTGEPASSISGPQAVRATGNSSSISDTKGFAVTPWYLNGNKLINSVTGKPYPFTGKELYATEIKSMKGKFPQAELHKLPNGELYWLLPVTINTGRRKESWTFMLKYDNNHPHPKDWGGSCKVIFLKPTVNELNARAMRLRGRGAPHILSLPGYDEKYLCAISKADQAEMMRTGNVQGAAAVAARAIRYAYMYLVGLDDLATWNEVCSG